MNVKSINLLPTFESFEMSDVRNFNLVFLSYMVVINSTDQCAVAGAGMDYVDLSPTELTFDAGSDTLEVPITINDDALVEDKEQFLVYFTIEDKTDQLLYGEVDKAIVVIFSEDQGKNFKC